MKVHRNELTNRLSKAITISANNGRLVKLQCRPEGFVTRVVVRQVTAADGGGTAAAFTVDIFERFSNIGITFPANGEIANGTAIPADAENIRIFPQKSALAGATIRDDTTGETGYTYRNGEGNNTNAVAELYLLLMPSGNGGITKWDITVITEAHVAGQ